VAEGLGGHPIDILTVQLRYFQHQEDHKLMLVDGNPARQSFETLEGTVGGGEFGTTLSAVTNIVEFREYRKFAADSTVDFGPPK
jgi:hypothetical protein